jgi:hypothetical protein
MLRFGCFIFDKNLYIVEFISYFDGSTLKPVHLQHVDKWFLNIYLFK